MFKKSWSKIFVHRAFWRR